MTEEQLRTIENVIRQMRTAVQQNRAVGFDPHTAAGLADLLELLLKQVTGAHDGFDLGNKKRH